MHPGESNENILTIRFNDNQLRLLTDTIGEALARLNERITHLEQIVREHKHFDRPQVYG